MWQTDQYSQLQGQRDMLDERTRKIQKEAATQKSLKEAKAVRAAQAAGERGNANHRSRISQPILRVARFVAGLF